MLDEICKIALHNPRKGAAEYSMQHLVSIICQNLDGMVIITSHRPASTQLNSGFPCNVMQVFFKVSVR